MVERWRRLDSTQARDIALAEIERVREYVDLRNPKTPPQTPEEWEANALDAGWTPPPKRARQLGVRSGR